MTDKPRSSPFAETVRPGPVGRKRATEIRDFLLAEVGANPTDIVRLAAERFGVSRQAVNKQIKRLVNEGLITEEGRTQGKIYRRASNDRTVRLDLQPDADEHEIWTSVAAPLLGSLPENVRDICLYGFTEMVNNVIDHSQSKTLTVSVSRTDENVAITIYDEGVGIFDKIQKAFGLSDPYEAIFELSKGKLTTDPDRHTGEGIFFTSRIFDSFGILSGQLYFGHRREEDDWLMERKKEHQRAGGTGVFLEIATNSTHTTQEVFDRYSTEQDDYAFTKTKVLVSLAQSNEADKLVSRSQAKRVLARLNRFKGVILDFIGIDSIGPAFADEIFRIYRRDHPEVHISVVNATPAVERMIARASAHD